MTDCITPYSSKKPAVTWICSFVPSETGDNSFMKFAELDVGRDAQEAFDVRAGSLTRGDSNEDTRNRTVI